jgi:outer membrane protein assembly factor BamB
VRVANECLPAGSSVPDAGPDAGIVVGDPVGDDGGTSDEAGSQSTNVGIDAAHHNAQAFDTIASPLTPAWVLHLNGTVGCPLIVHGMVIVAASEQPPNLRAVDLKTGASVWGPVPTGTFRRLAYDGGLVFGGDDDGNLTAFEAMTGRTVWAKRVPAPAVPVASAPVASGGIVYVHSPQLSAGTFAIDGRDGTLLWNVPARKGSSGAVAVGGGVVYSAEVCRTLFALDARTGRLNFANLGDCVGGGGATPSVYQDAIWERDSVDGNVIVGLAGKTRAQFATEMLPAFHAGTAFYLGRTQSLATALSAVDIATNVIKWSFSGDGGLCTSPAVAGGGGQVFVGSSSGNVYELDEATGQVRSVSNVGALRCWNENMSMSLGAGHLVVPAETSVVAY